jgi:hypothetical protein
MGIFSSVGPEVVATQSILRFNLFGKDPYETALATGDTKKAAELLAVLRSGGLGNAGN